MGEGNGCGASGPGPLPLSLAPFLLPPSEVSKAGPSPTRPFLSFRSHAYCGLFAQADGGMAAGVRVELAHSAVERALEARPHPVPGLPRTHSAPGLPRARRRCCGPVRALSALCLLPSAQAPRRVEVTAYGRTGTEDGNNGSTG